MSQVIITRAAKPTFLLGISRVLGLQRSHRWGAVCDSAEFANSIVWFGAPMVLASARVPSMTALFSPGLLRGIYQNRLGEMCVFGIQHPQIVLPMIHMDFIPHITQKLDDIVFLFIMKF